MVGFANHFVFRPTKMFKAVVARHLGTMLVFLPDPLRPQRQMLQIVCRRWLASSCGKVCTVMRSIQVKKMGRYSRNWFYV